MVSSWNNVFWIVLQSALYQTYIEGIKTLENKFIVLGIKFHILAKFILVYNNSSREINEGVDNITTLGKVLVTAAKFM